MDIDTIIMGTGYIECAEFLDTSIISDDGGMLKLYKYAFPCDMKHPTLAIAGYVRTKGPLGPIYEMQVSFNVFQHKSNLYVYCKQFFVGLPCPCRPSLNFTVDFTMSVPCLLSAVEMHLLCRPGACVHSTLRFSFTAG